MPSWLLILLLTRKGNGVVLGVRGAMMIVLSFAFITFGETITQGRVFCISDPRVGSRVARCMSPKLSGFSGIGIYGIVNGFVGCGVIEAQPFVIFIC